MVTCTAVMWFYVPVERERKEAGMWLHVSAAFTESWRTRDTLFTPQLNAKVVVHVPIPGCFVYTLPLHVSLKEETRTNNVNVVNIK